MTPVIEIDGLRKEYARRRLMGPGQARRRGGPRRVVAIDGLDLSVPEGGVFGFLGPNGSGKTTTIRCLLGLVRPTSGEVRLFGEDVRVALPHAIRRVGSIVETPMFFPTMSARENLRLLGAIDRIPAPRVDAMLERVGLGERADDDVRRFSLGMRQRLGLAAALLKDPALVILDEPANGLDPAGMREVRDVLRTLGDEGRTVLVSSHLLAEVEQTCDRVAILKRGRCVATGTVDEVLGRADGELVVRVADLVAGAAALGRAGIAVQRCDDHLLARVGSEDSARVTEVLAAERLWVSELRVAEHSLEERFLELTAADELPEVLEVVA
ncbi:MAG: ABC transporter ATP-binding protein [Acidimicrobiia bacterium]